ncbi:hypothetical protein DSL72_006679 [Monilinia vaccinii-corymbosi]|uniref:Apple domain-containing protein n=1 Tax=Monilinia vaccinii-corymbosi TaxID=61207 RepID=A0A8A3PPQ4_9HELO|nr:hypothetical protein DSL72_006679 [Monilinia vaccinii-corymbosi]
MRSATIVSALAALAVANPVPQVIDLSAVDALPEASVSSAPDDVAYQSVHVKPPAAATSAGVAKVTAVAVPAGAARKRNIIKRSCCDVQPAGAGPTSTPDTAEAFLADPQYNAIASGATTPAGYKLAFSQLHGSSQTTSYLGYETLDSYDTEGCASYCDQQEGCIAFNLYMERDPTLEPGANCTNPASTTNFKCVKWGVQISNETATNIGQWRREFLHPMRPKQTHMQNILTPPPPEDFHAVISGSNGYNKQALPPSAPGYDGPTPLPGAINAPLDPTTQTDTYMGYQYFAFNDVQTFTNGVIACTSACTAQTRYNAAHPPATGNAPVCNQAIVYILNDNGAPQGIYCAMYTEAWAPAYATNVGQYRGPDYWSVTQAYAFTTSTYAAQYPPICALDACPAGSYAGGNHGGYGAALPAYANATANANANSTATLKCKSKRSKRVRVCERERLTGAIEMRTHDR